MDIFNANFSLTFKDIVLRPVSKEDDEGFKKIAFVKDIWKYTPGMVMSNLQLDQFIDNALAEFKARTRMAFTILKNNEIVGSSSYGNISIKDSRLEIGWTWLGVKYQGLGINQICKFLLIDNAFTNMDMARIEFKTDVLNLKSRKALSKIGAVEEGVLRSHTLMHDSRRRDTVYYSILKNEWPDIKIKKFNNLL